MSGIPGMCIIDANIIFDFVVGGILEALFRLEYKFVSTDFVIYEIKSIEQSELERYGLEVVELPEAMISEIYRLRSENRALSIEDLSLLVFAKYNPESILVSGDGPLRRKAQHEKIEFHGTLWLLDQIVVHGIIQAAEAATALQLMEERRLPPDEYRDRLQQWLDD